MIQVGMFLASKRTLRHPVNNGKIDGRPYVILVSGYSSHVTLSVVKCTVDKLGFFQLSSLFSTRHTRAPNDGGSHMSMTTTRAQDKRAWRPLEATSAEARLSRSRLSTPSQHVVASSRDSELWHMDEDRVMNRIKCQRKRVMPVSWLDSYRLK